jgi:hypothetical protein
MNQTLKSLADYHFGDLVMYDDNKVCEVASFNNDIDPTHANLRYKNGARITIFSDVPIELITLIIKKNNNES